MPALILAALLAAEAPVAPLPGAAAPSVESAPASATVPPEAETSAAPERLLASEVTAGVGLLGSSYAQPGFRLGDAHVLPVVTARYLLGGFTAEAGVLLAAPVTRDGTAYSFTGSLRVGWTWRKWSVVAGALMQWADGAQQPDVHSVPTGAALLQWLPTLRVSGDFGRFGMSFGVLDHLGLVPAHLSFDLEHEGRRFSLGWVVPVGLVATADLPVTQRFGLRFSGFAFKAFGAEMAMFTVAGTFGGGR